MLAIGLMLVAASLRAGITGVGPLLDRTQADFGLSAVAAGLVNALPLIAFAVASPLVPRLVVGYGPERALVLALVVIVVGSAVRWLPSVVALFAGTALLGSGIAVGNVVLPALVKRDFPDSIGLLTSVYATVMGTVAGIASGVVVPLSDAVPGDWRTALACWGLLVVPALLVWVPKAIRNGPTPAMRDGGGRLPVRSSIAWAVTAFMGLQSASFYVMVTWGPSVFHHAGVAPATAGWLLFVHQVVGVISGLLVPPLQRRLRDQRGLAVGCASLIATGYLGLLLWPAGAVVWSVVVGIGSGGSLVLALGFMSLRAHDPTAAAGLSAMAQSGGYAIAAVGPFVFGALHSVTGGWVVPLAFVCCVAVGQGIAGLRAGHGTVESRRQMEVR